MARIYLHKATLTETSPQDSLSLNKNNNRSQSTPLADWRLFVLCLREKAFLVDIPTLQLHFGKTVALNTAMSSYSKASQENIRFQKWLCIANFIYVNTF